MKTLLLMFKSLIDYCSPRKHFFGYLLVLLVLSYFSLFHKLGRLNLRIWDEASYALNAIEMLDSNEYINLYQFGKNDFYNTKPPFAIWCMAGSIKVLGANELGIRLPSALFSLFSVLLIYFFIGGYLNKPIAGLLSGCILISSSGFVMEHASRTGDTDSILAFWILFYTLFFYKSKYSTGNLFLYLGFLGVTFACLTKGLSGLIATPAIALFFIVDPVQRKKWLNPHLYIGGLLFLFVIIGYYLLREYKAPGFLDAVYFYEWGGRVDRQTFLNPQSRGFDYFLTELINIKYTNWYIWLIISLCSPIIFFRKKIFRARVLYFAVVFIASYTLISISATKNAWYDVPLYPLAALLIGVSILRLMASFSYESRLIGTFVFLLTFIPSYYAIVNKNMNEKETEYYGSFLTEYRKSHPFDCLTFINSDCNFALQFYLKIDKNKGFISREVNANDNSIKPGDRIVVFHPAREYEMNLRFQMELLYDYNGVKLYEIKVLK